MAHACLLTGWNEDSRPSVNGSPLSVLQVDASPQLVPKVGEFRLGSYC